MRDDEKITDGEWDLFVKSHWTVEEEASLMLTIISEES